MINSEIINERQNEEHLLKIQYASRRYFNDAEKINYLIWLVCIISALMTFLPCDVPEFVRLGIPILLEVSAFVLTYFFEYALKRGAELRNYFDSYVLMIDNDKYSETETQRIKEIALSMYERHKSDAEISIRNTGTDVPPGIRNWYEFKNPINDEAHAQYECQKQNVWWNKKMVNNRLVIFSIIAIFLISVLVILLAVFHVNKWAIIVCMAGLILKFLGRIEDHYKYHKTSISIDTLLAHAEKHLSSDDIHDLQNLINDRRYIQVLEINFIHKFKAKKYSSLYQESK